MKLGPLIFRGVTTLGLVVAIVAPAFPQEAGGSDLRIDELSGGRLRVHSSSTSLGEILRGVARSMGARFYAPDAVLETLDLRTPSVDLEDVTPEEALEYLAGAYGLDAHVRDGKLVIEARTEPSEPAYWAERKERAIAMLRRSLLRYPGYSQAWQAYVQIGDLHYRDSMYEEAISEYRMVLGIDAPAEGLAEAKLRLGRAYLALGEPTRARFYFADFIRTHPEHPGFVEAYEGIARCFLLEGDGIMAARSLELLLENELDDGDAARVSRLQGDVYAGAGKFEEAAESYGNALEIGLPASDRAPTWLALAEALIGANHPKESIEAVSKFFDEAPPANEAQHARAWLIAGHGFSDLEMRTEELLAFSRAHRFDEESYDAVVAWGQALESTGLLEKAVEVYRGFIGESEAERREISVRLGSAYEELGLLEKARLAYVVWHESGGGDDAVLAVSRMLERQGEYGPCADWIGSSELESPDAHRRAVERMGRCLEALDRTEEALALYLGRDESTDIESIEEPFEGGSEEKQP